MRWLIPLLFLSSNGCGFFATQCRNVAEICEPDCPPKKAVCNKEPAVECETPKTIVVKLPPAKIVVEQQQPAPPPQQQTMMAMPQQPMYAQQPQMMYAQQPQMMMPQQMMMMPVQQPAVESRPRLTVGLDIFHIPLPLPRLYVVPGAPVQQQPMMMAMPQPMYQQPMMQAGYMQPQAMMMPQQAMMVQQPQPQPMQATVNVPVQGTMTVPVQGQVAQPCVPIPPLPAQAVQPGTVTISAAQAEEFCRMVEALKKKADAEKK